MTSSDKPDTADVPTETNREERAVVTAPPAGESGQATKTVTTAKPATNGGSPNGTATTNGTASTENAADGATSRVTGGAAPADAQPTVEPATVEVEQPKPAAQPPARSAPSSPAAARSTPQPATPPVAQPKVQPTKPVQQPKTPAKPKVRDVSDSPTVVAKPVGDPDVSATTPPWQRVASDAAHLAESDGKGGFSEWGYQRSPRSESYSEQEAKAADALAGGVVSGTASPSLFAGAAGQSGVRADARPSTDPSGRTTVNFGAVPSSARSSTGVTPPSALRRPGRGPRRASLQVKRVDPWSVLKLAFVLSVALFFVWLVAVGVLYGVLDGMGVWDRVNGTYNEFAQNTSSGSSGPLITASRVFGIAAVIGAINIVLFTALATVGSFVYNVSADLAGGLEITLAERE